MSFSSQVDDFILGVADSTDETIKGSAIALFGAIIKASPVDEGTFRANWYVTKDKPSTRVNPNGSAGENVILNRTANRILGIENYKRIIMTNNLPYAPVIEFGEFPTGSANEAGSKVTTQGYSRQAPQGVVRTNVLRFRQIFEEQARKNGFQ